MYFSQNIYYEGKYESVTICQTGSFRSVHIYFTIFIRPFFLLVRCSHCHVCLVSHFDIFHLVPCELQWLCVPFFLLSCAHNTAELFSSSV